MQLLHTCPADAVRDKMFTLYSGDDEHPYFDTIAGNNKECRKDSEKVMAFMPVTGEGWVIAHPCYFPHEKVSPY